MDSGALRVSLVSRMGGIGASRVYLVVCICVCLYLCLCLWPRDGDVAVCCAECGVHGTVIVGPARAHSAETPSIF
jgi:hypothetical protein